MSAASAVTRVQSEIVGATHSAAWTQTSEETIPERIRNHGFAVFCAENNRMFPWIRRGDLVFVRRMDFAAARTGDYILFERGSRAVLRRMLRRVATAESRCGEAALLVTSHVRERRIELVTARQFLGRAIRIHRRKRHIDMETFGRKMMARALAILARI